jgi:hypothetical protein
MKSLLIIIAIFASLSVNATSYSEYSNLSKKMSKFDKSNNYKVADEDYIIHLSLSNSCDAMKLSISDCEFIVSKIRELTYTRYGKLVSFSNTVKAIDEYVKIYARKNEKVNNYDIMKLSIQTLRYI